MLGTVRCAGDVPVLEGLVAGDGIDGIADRLVGAGFEGSENRPLLAALSLNRKRLST
jgi:hypothetical protein